MSITRRVPIVADDQELASVLRGALEVVGRFNVRISNRGRGTVEPARTVKPDVIVLDVAMPDMDGTAVAESINDDERLADIPTIFPTGLVTARGSRPQGLDIPGKEVPAKPPSMGTLVQSIEEVLA